MSFRYNIGHAGSPVQQSMTVLKEQYKSMHIGHSMKGVVLSLQYADDPENRSAQQTTTRHGFIHEATVLIVDDGRGNRMTLDHVMILPHRPSGIDSYHEFLPRPCSLSLDGNTLDPTFQNVSPNELDGDWCIVSFIGGNIDSPYISSWWPHSRNVYDTLTSGQGHFDTNGTPQALDQTGRYFDRINGVEYLITKQGDIYLSTKYAGSLIDPSMPSVKGRYPRTERSQIGGSVKVNIKPSQTFELSFVDPVDGEGISGNDDSLPQTNPRPQQASSALQTATEARLIMSSGTFELNVPTDFSISSGDTGTLRTTGDMKISANGNLTQGVGGKFSVAVNEDSRLISKGTTRTQGLSGTELIAGFPTSTQDPVAPMDIRSTGELSVTSGVIIDPASPPPTPAIPADMNILATGMMNITAGNEQDTTLPPANLTIESTGNTTVDSTLMLNLDGSEINLGSLTSLPPNNTLLTKNFSADATLISTLNAAMGALTGSPAQNAAAIEAMKLALQALVNALTNTATTKTKGS